MECGTLTAVEEGPRPGDNFVSLEFNLVLIVALTFMLLRNNIFGYLVDIVAGVLLIYATLVRKQILYEGREAGNFCAASEETVYTFFVYSLVSWVASAIIEFKSCRFLICKIRLGGYDVRTLSKKQFCALMLSLFVSANACWVMLQYSSAVHKSFEGLTNDRWLLLYYLLAAAAKNSRVFLQGLVYTSWVPEHPSGFIPEKYRNQRMAMGRMGITNFIMLLQALFLSAFPNDASMSTINKISLIVDIIYRIIVCIWFLQNGCRHVKTTLLSAFTRITSSCNSIVTSIYNSIFTRTPEDPNHGAAEADPRIVSGIPGDLNNAAVKADPSVTTSILEDRNQAEAPEHPHSNELMLNINLQATASVCDNDSTATTECHSLHDSENQVPQFIATSAPETTNHCLSRAEVESSVASFIHSVEEESLNLNYLTGIVLSSNSLFVPSPSNDISHTECQNLIESHTGHNTNHLELIQSFPDISDLDSQSILFQQSSEVFKPPQLETDTLFAPSLESLVTGITLLNVASLSTGKSQLVAGNVLLGVASVSTDEAQLVTGT